MTASLPPRSVITIRRICHIALFCSIATTNMACSTHANANKEATIPVPHNPLFGVDRITTKNDDTPLSRDVNAYLWRGALDTLSFMPFFSTDAIGGVIITDWYSPPTTLNERFKVTAYILDSYLRSDAIQVSVFRQIKSQSCQDNTWRDAAIDPHIGANITDKIITRARQLRANRK